jgi:uncharacterized protein
MKPNKCHSYNLKKLPNGCLSCILGQKVVIFITGICPRKCYFCPVSDHKFGKDDAYANERKINSTEDLFKECELMQAKGAGITGGDPLSRLDRTVEYIQILKEKYGKEFHIHLYTSLNLVTKETLKKLYDAGLDEIRFHFDLDNDKFWKNVTLANEFEWDVGVELPLVPTKEKEIQKIIDFIQDKVSFMNLNELEIADNSLSKLGEMDFKVKNQLSYAIEGSLESGIRLLEYIQEKEYPLQAHLCTAKLKDAVQLTNRIKRESENVKKEYDIVDDEGLLIRGALYLYHLKPGFEYRKKLAEVDKSKFIDKLKPLYDRIKKKFKLDDKDIFLDEEKPRILISRKLVKKKKAYFLGLDLFPAIVTEYPTADQLEIEVEFLE